MYCRARRRLNREQLSAGSFRNRGPSGMALCGVEVVEGAVVGRVRLEDHDK